MRLLITRHGETIENKAGILQGHTEGTLSGLGIEQAEKLASRLKNEKNSEKINSTYSFSGPSPLNRDLNNLNYKDYKRAVA